MVFRPLAPKGAKRHREAVTQLILLKTTLHALDFLHALENRPSYPSHISWREALGLTALRKQINPSSAMGKSAVTVNSEAAAADATARGVQLLKESKETKLELVDCGIGVNGAKALAKALRENAVLTDLNLDSNKFGPDGAKAIAEALKDHTSLTSFSLGANGIGPKGAKAIAKALKENRTVKTLALRGNNIGMEGARAIAETLDDENNQLVNVRLGGNSIPHEGMKMIAMTLRKNRPILKVVDQWLLPVVAVVVGWLLKCAIKRLWA